MLDFILVLDPESDCFSFLSVELLSLDQLLFGWLASSRSFALSQLFDFFGADGGAFTGLDPHFIV